MAESSTSNPDPSASRAWQLTELITRLRRVLRASVRSDIPWETLPMAQIEVLQRLDDEPGIRISDLAERHRLATNTVSTLIQQMAGAGLVERATDPTDRRATILTMTALGRQRLDEWLSANNSRVDAALTALDATQRDHIEAALPALVALAEQLEHREAP